jgi:hypothetical protein
MIVGPPPELQLFSDPNSSRQFQVGLSKSAGAVRQYIDGGLRGREIGPAPVSPGIARDVVESHAGYTQLW